MPHPLVTLLKPIGKALRRRRADASRSLAEAPDLRTPNRLRLSSPSFADGGEIPVPQLGGFMGSNRSPALAWDGLPPGTADLLLLMEDLSVPRPTPVNHMIVAFPPEGDGLAEGALVAGAPGVRFLDLGRGPKYLGPMPMPGHGPHHYRFHLYALDAPVDLAGVRRAAELPAALAGHVLASGTITGVREA